MEKPKQEQNNEKELIARLNNLVDQLYKKFPDDILSITKKKADKLKIDYPNYFEYKAYHILAGSTPLKNTPYVDFPGDDSVEIFFQSVLQNNI